MSYLQQRLGLFPGVSRALLASLKGELGELIPEIRNLFSELGLNAKIGALFTETLWTMLRVGDHLPGRIMVLLKRLLKELYPELPALSIAPILKLALLKDIEPLSKHDKMKAPFPKGLLQLLSAFQQRKLLPLKKRIL